jgi:predicted metalloendopeptidase
MTENEATELAKTIDDELEARVINDEVDAHKINDSLSQVEQTDPPVMQNSQRQMMENYFKSQDGHTPGKEFVLSDTTYLVQDTPHRGMWVRRDLIDVVNPNMNNNSVRRKLAKKPTNKYVVVSR